MNLDAIKIDQACHIMFDIEALGAHPGCVVTSIGAVQFVPFTGEIIDEFKENIAIQSSLNKGMEVTGSTIEWWFNQSKSAQLAMIERACPIEDAISMLSSWASKRRLYENDLSYIDRKNLFWWANGANFDFGLVDACYRACGKTWVPWHYRNLMDMRTIRTMLGYRAPDEYFANEVKHDAVVDCRLQIKQLKDMIEIMTGEKQ